MSDKDRALHVGINTRGYYEQEKGYFFPGLYPNYTKRVSRYENGRFKEFLNRHKLTRP